MIRWRNSWYDNSSQPLITGIECQSGQWYQRRVRRHGWTGDTSLPEEPLRCRFVLWVAAHLLAPAATRWPHGRGHCRRWLPSRPAANQQLDLNAKEILHTWLTFITTIIHTCVSVHVNTNYVNEWISGHGNFWKSVQCHSTELELPVPSTNQRSSTQGWGAGPMTAHAWIRLTRLIAPS